MKVRIAMRGTTRPAPMLGGDIPRAELEWTEDLAEAGRHTRKRSNREATADAEMLAVPDYEWRTSEV